MKVASTGLSRDVPAGSLRLVRRSDYSVSHLGCGGRWRGADLGMQRLQHAGGFLAARHAQVQPFLFLGEQRIRIVLAVVAALAAVLLAHRRHHTAWQGPALGKLHALSEWHGLVMPRCAVVVFGRSPDLGAGQQRLRFLLRQRGGVAVEQPCEESIQPDALLGGERRALRNDGSEWRAHRGVHAAAPENIPVSAAISCRRANAWKVSSREARRAR